MTVPAVELLYWDGCPSWPRALAELREELAAAGLDPGGITVREVITDADAEAERFSGSPMIRIDGEDAVPVPGEPAALACRIYHTRDARISPVPDRADVRAAIERAIHKRRS
jgi:hypothetical protein